MTRKIIHVDMDCFYASVEIRDNPSLKGKPVAVGGSVQGRGVLTTASYEARKYGVRSAMPTGQALKLCPDLILVPVHFDKYRKASGQVREVFRRYTDKIQPLSLDEAYLDVTDSEACSGSATRIAQEIRREIFAETRLTASAGIAPNKFLAKVASDWKKPNGQFTVTPKKVSEFVRDLPIEKIPGVGKVTAKKMHALNIKTCADLQKWSLEELSHRFGVWGLRLYDLCRGKDESSVSSGGKRKSLSVESTYAQDLMTLEECLARLPKLFEEFQRRFQRAQVHDEVKSLVVKVKFTDFEQTTLERAAVKIPSLESYSQMIEEAYLRKGKPVRLLGLGVRLAAEKTSVRTTQMSLF